MLEQILDSQLECLSTGILRFIVGDYPYKRLCNPSFVNLLDEKIEFPPRERLNAATSDTKNKLLTIRFQIGVLIKTSQRVSFVHQQKCSLF